MQNFRKMGALLGAGAVIFSLAGCADRNGNGQPDSAATGGEVGNAAAGATNAVADAGGTVANGAAEAGAAASNTAAGAGAAISNGAAEAGAAISNTAASAGAAASNAAAGAANAVTGAGAALTLTPKIKTALGTQATSGLKGSSIDVDTVAASKTVTLTGTVKSAAQKTLAGAIAKKNAADFKVVNQLKVG